MLNNFLTWALKIRQMVIITLLTLLSWFKHKKRVFDFTSKILICDMRNFVNFDDGW